MDMDHLIGQRFNLISKSEIRYVGTLHEINPEQSTIALEDVYSFGTEGRKVENFIPASQQKFDYIVFRGSDVKDIKIAEEQTEPKPSPPPNVPNDPAILNASRPGPSSQGPPPSGPPPHLHAESPFPPPGYPPQFGGYYPPHQQFGRGYGPPPPPGQFGPGSGAGFPPFGPPPGYYGPPSQGFPQGPNQFQPPPPIGPPGHRQNTPQAQQHQQQQQPPQQSALTPIDAPRPTSELPDNKAPKTQAKASATSVQSAETAVPPSAVKPPTAEASVPTPTPTTAAPTTTAKPVPTGPKVNRVTPAIPLTVNQKSFVPPVTASAEGPQSNANGTKSAAKPASSQAAMDEAARQAKEAVAAAMAKLNPASAQAKPPPPSTAAIDALSQKVREMGPTTNGAQRGRGGPRGGRGNYQRSGSGGHQNRKIDIPKSDYDFESANAKFNKEDMIKEAIASGSPIGETPDEITNGTAEDGEESLAGPNRKDSMPLPNTQAYNKSTSFFDNISSEAKDREDSQEGRLHGRQVRGEEFKKNLETFGQGNVDGGYRGRGGRGGFGRGRQYGGTYRGYNRGYGGGYRGRGRGGAAQGPGQATVATPAPAPTQ